MVRAWDIYLWQGEIITGGHGEFSRGEVIRFPPRCSWDEMTRTDQREKSIVRTHRWRRPYRVVAQVLQVTKLALVIDFGILAFARPFLVPDNPSPGDFITGDITVLIDSSEVASVHKDIRDFSALYQRWEIQAITKRISPLVPVFNVSGIQNYLHIDDRHATYETIERTDSLRIGAVHNDDLYVDYRLRCRLLTAH